MKKTILSLLTLLLVLPLIVGAEERIVDPDSIVPVNDDQVQEIETVTFQLEKTAPVTQRESFTLNDLVSDRALLVAQRDDLNKQITDVETQITLLQAEIVKLPPRVDVGGIVSDVEASIGQPFDETTLEENTTVEEPSGVGMSPFVFWGFLLLLVIAVIFLFRKKLQ